MHTASSPTARRPRRCARRRSPSCSSSATGRSPSCRGSARRSRTKLVALDETGQIPQAVEAAREVPARADRDHAPARLRPEARAAALRRARDRLARGAARRGRAPRAARAARVRREGRGEAARDARRAAHDGTPGAARAALPRAPDRRADRRRRCARHPARDRVEVAGSLRRQADAVKDLDVIATADDPRQLVEALVAPAARRVRARPPATAGARGRHPHRAEGRPQGRRARPVRQRAPALHRLQGPQRRAARVGGPARPARLRVRDPRRRDRRDAALRDRGGGLRDARPPVHRAGAARGPRRARGGRRRASCRELVTLEDLRGDLHCHTVASDGTQDDRGDGDAARRPAATSTWRSPTTPPSHGFGNDVSPGQLARADRAVASSTRSSTASSC